MTTEFAPQPELDEETSDLWDGEFRKFVDKGGFASLLKDIPTQPQTLDLNIYLRTFEDLSKEDLHVEYIIPGLAPEKTIITLSGKQGLGKSFLAQKIGNRISQGHPFLGLPTKKVPVYYIDFENPLAMLADRTRILGSSPMKLWHLSDSIPPPRLDSNDWVLFKSLFPGVLIIDTLRSCQLLDDNSSRDMALVMGRLKELREIGFTIILLHHTQKADDRKYKGSSAIVDLCDHALGLERVREVGSDAVVDNDEADLPLRLGTREKTRFEPFSIFLKFDPSRGFSLANNPDDELLSNLQDILGDNEFNQTEFFKLAKEELSINRKKFLRLLKKGEGKFWMKSRLPKGRAMVYCPFVPNQGDFSKSQVTENKGLSHCPDTENSTGTTMALSHYPHCSPL